MTTSCTRTPVSGQNERVASRLVPSASFARDGSWEARKSPVLLPLQSVWRRWRRHGDGGLSFQSRHALWHVQGLARRGHLEIGGRALQSDISPQCDRLW